MLAVKDLFKAANSFFNLAVLTIHTGKNLGNKEGLGEETLNPTCTTNRDLILFRELVHTENGDNILQLFILLQGNLYATCCLVMFFADNHWIQDTGS